ncbi:hypothetical protein TNCV_2448571 [Trichonephila clavipes]|uniref:Uncharacterized protein n=1 Tax=Trichonephila clavipes TaxID=2585209 RepID=A0A8X6SQL4_TRICX|nr:hypothetical protein TNCV_2448571 [Trichonephila clavipes]
MRVPPRIGGSQSSIFTPSSLKKILIREKYLFGSPCAAEQFHNDASLEAVEQQAPNNSKNWQRTMEGDVSA